MSNAWCMPGAASYVALTLLYSADLSRVAGVTSAVNPGFDQSNPGATGCFGDQANWTNTAGVAVNVTVQQTCMFSLLSDGRCRGRIATDQVAPSPPPPSPPPVYNCDANRGFCCLATQMSPLTSSPACGVLADLYFTSGGGNGTWLRSDGWAAAASSQRVDMCTLYGVLCSQDGSVIGIALANNGLTGPLDAMGHKLNLLSNLTALDLSGNALSALPALLPTGLLSLALSNASLMGTLPPTLSSLAALTSLRLSNNGLSGVIPSAAVAAWAATLSELRLDGNALSGLIPTAISTLTRLTTLLLSGNSLTGTLPDLTPLTSLALFAAGGNAALTGPLPVLSSALTELRLSGTALTGTIPTAYGSLSRLTTLDLSRNPGLTGAMPPLAGLPLLTRLDVSACSLSGALPAAPSALAFANVSYNGFVGSLDASWTTVCASGAVALFPQQQYSLGIALAGVQATTATAAELVSAFANPCVTSITVTADVSMSGQIALQRRMVALIGTCAQRCSLLAANNSRHFLLNESFLSLSGVQLSAGRASLGGAVLADARSYLLLQGATLSGNQAGSGGAIYTLGAPVIITSSALQNNTATTGAGGALCTAPASYAPVTASGSAFVANAAFSSGGALWGDLFKLTNCSMSRNTASSGSGGAVAASGVTGGVVVVAASAFGNNSCGAHGGALSILGALTDSTVAIGGNTSFSGNAAGANGGAVAVTGIAAVSINDTAVSQNGANASTGMGGALWLSNVPSVGMSRVSASGNLAAQGGAVAAVCSSANVCGAASFSIDASSFSANSAAALDGGALFFGSQGTFAALSRSQFVSNAAVSAGGALSGDAIAVNGCMFSSNSVSSGGGGAIYATGSVGATIAGSAFVNNSCASSGGALFGDYNGGAASVAVSASTFTGNAALDGDGGGNGGALALAGATVSVDATACALNAAGAVTGAGGAMWVQDALGLTITSTSISNNTVAMGAGVAITHDSASCGSTMLMQGVALSGNVASIRGGALALDGCSLVLRDSLLSDNVAVGLTARGGGVYVDDSSQEPLSVTLQNTTLLRNSAVMVNAVVAPGVDQISVAYAQGYGGGFFALSLNGCTNVSIANSVIDSSNASNAGGLFMDGCVTLLVQSSSLIRNVAVNDAGALLVTRGASAQLLGSNFTSNSANTGAAVSVQTTATLVASACVFSANAAAFGAVFAMHALDAPVPSLTLSALTATGNTASGAGAFGFTDAMAAHTAPACTGCAISNVPAGPLFVSAPRTFNASTALVTGSSSNKLPPFEVYMYDIYGQLVPEWPVTVAVATTSATATDGAGLSGVTTVAYTRGSAHFAAVVASDLVGTAYNLSYALSSATLPELMGAAAVRRDRAVNGNTGSLTARIAACQHLEQFDVLQLACICQAGSYLDLLAGECTSCPLGTYSASAGAETCTPNPAGFASKVVTTFDSSVQLAGVTPDGVAASQNASLVSAIATAFGVDASTVAITSIGAPAAAAQRRRRALLQAAQVGFRVSAADASAAGTLRAAFDAGGGLEARLASALRASGDPALAAVSGASVASPQESVVATAAEPCTVGTYLDVLSGSCQPCADDMVTTTVGATACESCPANYARVSASECVPCPDNSRTAPVDPGACACNGGVGFYDARFGASKTEPLCLPCPKGAICTSGLAGAAAGYWRSSTVSDVFFRCHLGNCLQENVTGPLSPVDGTAGVSNATALRRLLAQLVVAVTGNLSNATAPTNCVFGNTGALCEMCLPGYAVQEGVCLPCKPTDAWASWNVGSQTALLVGAISGGLTFLAFAFFQPVAPVLEDVAASATAWGKAKASASADWAKGAALSCLSCITCVSLVRRIMPNRCKEPPADAEEDSIDGKPRNSGHSARADPVESSAKPAEPNAIDASKAVHDSAVSAAIWALMAGSGRASETSSQMANADGAVGHAGGGDEAALVESGGSANVGAANAPRPAAVTASRQIPETILEAPVAQTYAPVPRAAVDDKAALMKPDNALADAKAIASGIRWKREFLFAAGLAAQLQGIEQEEEEGEDADKKKSDDEQDDEDDDGESEDDGVGGMINMEQELAALVNRLQKYMKIVVKCVALRGTHLIQSFLLTRAFSFGFLRPQLLSGMHGGYAYGGSACVRRAQALASVYSPRPGSR